MAFPVNARSQNFVDGVTNIVASFLHAIQDAIIGVVGGGKTVKALHVDGTGDQPSSANPGDVFATGNLLAGATASGAKVASTDKALGIEWRDGSAVYAYRRVGSVQTTNNTSTTVLSIPVPTGKTAMLFASAAGLRNDSAAGAYAGSAAGFRNNGGTVSRIGSDQTTIPAQQDGGWGAIVFSINGTNIDVKVQGGVGITVNWGLFVDVTVSS